MKYILILTTILVALSCNKEDYSLCDEQAIMLFYESFPPKENSSCLWYLALYEKGFDRIYTHGNPCLDLDPIYRNCKGERVEKIKGYKFIEHLAIQKVK